MYPMTITSGNELVSSVLQMFKDKNIRPEQAMAIEAAAHLLTGNPCIFPHAAKGKKQLVKLPDRMVQEYYSAVAEALRDTGICVSLLALDDAGHREVVETGVYAYTCNPEELSLLMSPGDGDIYTEVVKTY